MSRNAIPSWYFAFTIVRKANRFLLVNESKDRGWYFPAGRVEQGETFEAAALRETLEESGVPVVLEGILRIEHSTWEDRSTRMRIFYLARPTDDTPPTKTADKESLGAGWFTLNEAAKLPLRGEEVLECLRKVESGCHVSPLELITTEGAPWA